MSERTEQDATTRETDAEPRNKEFPPACCRDCEHVEHCRAVDDNDPRCQKERKDWLAERKNSIGASDAAAALSASPWKSQFQLWSEKVGLAEPPSLDDNEAVKWGKRLEKVILQAYAEDSGRTVSYGADVDPDAFELLCTRNPMIGNRDVTYRHPDRLFMTATPDAFTKREKSNDLGVVEAKAVGYWLGKDWEKEPPLHYQIQVQHQLAVTGLEWGSLAVLIAGQKLLWFDVDRDDAFIEQMMAKEAWFWTQVLDKVPVPVDGSIATTDTLRRLYPKDDGEIIPLPRDAAAWDADLAEAKLWLANWDKVKRHAENKLKAALGNATCGILPNGDQYTFKQQTNHYPAKEASESSFRVLRRKANK